MKKVIALSVVTLLSGCQTYNSGYDWFSAEVLGKPVESNEARWAREKADAKERAKEVAEKWEREQREAEERRKAEMQEQERLEQIEMEKRYKARTTQLSKIDKLTFSSTANDVLETYDYQCKTYESRIVNGDDFTTLVCTDLYDIKRYYYFSNGKMTRMDM